MLTIMSRLSTTAAVLLLLTTPASADRKAPLRMLVFAPPAFVHETLMHETMHIVAVLTMRGAPDSFRPWPGRACDGKWRFAHYTIPYEQRHLNEHPWVVAAPYIVDVAAFVASDVALTWVKPGGWKGSLLLVMGMLAPLLNFAVNYTASWGDWQTLRDRSPAFGIIGGMLIGAGALRVGYRFVQAIRH